MSAGETATRPTVADLAARAAAEYGPKAAIRYRREGEWQSVSFEELAQIVDEVALGLLALGIEPGDRVSVLANTRPEWTYASLGISRVGAVVVPVYPTNSPEECEWVVGNSDAVAIVAEDSGQLTKIEKVRTKLPSLQHLISIERADGAMALDELR